MRLPISRPAPVLACLAALAILGCDPEPDATAPTSNAHGIDATVWTEVSWLPADVTEIGRMSEPLPIVSWLRSMKLDEDDDCKAALDAISHYYMVDRPGDDPEASTALVFVGSVPIDETEKCAKAFSERLGFEVTRDGDALTLTQAPPEGVEVEGGPGVLALRWTTKNDTAMVLGDDPARLDALAAAEAKGTLDTPDGAGMRTLLAKTRTGGDAGPWIVGTRDVSAFWLGTPGQGYVGTLMQTRERMVVMGELVFADRAAAEAANANVDTLYSDAKFLEPSFSGFAELPPAPATSLRFRAEVPLGLADLAKLEDAMTKVRQIRELEKTTGTTIPLAGQGEAAADGAPTGDGEEPEGAPTEGAPAEAPTAEAPPSPAEQAPPEAPVPTAPSP